MKNWGNFDLSKYDKNSFLETSNKINDYVNGQFTLLHTICMKPNNKNLLRLKHIFKNPCLDINKKAFSNGQTALHYLMIYFNNPGTKTKKTTFTSTMIHMFLDRKDLIPNQTNKMNKTAFRDYHPCIMTSQVIIKIFNHPNLIIDLDYIYSLLEDLDIVMLEHKLFGCYPTEVVCRSLLQHEKIIQMPCFLFIIHYILSHLFDCDAALRNKIVKHEHIDINYTLEGQTIFHQIFDDNDDDDSFSNQEFWFLKNLLKYKDIDFNKRDHKGRTMLHLITKNFKIFDLELEQKIILDKIALQSDVNAMDNKGRTPLWYLLRTLDNNQDPFLSFLIDMGAYCRMYLPKGQQMVLRNNANKDSLFASLPREIIELIIEHCFINYSTVQELFQKLDYYKNLQFPQSNVSSKNKKRKIEEIS